MLNLSATNPKKAVFITLRNIFSRIYKEKKIYKFFQVEKKTKWKNLKKNIKSFLFCKSFCDKQNLMQILVDSDKNANEFILSLMIIS